MIRRDRKREADESFQSEVINESSARKQKEFQKSLLWYRYLACTPRDRDHNSSCLAKILRLEVCQVPTDIDWRDTS